MGIYNRGAACRNELPDLRWRDDFSDLPEACRQSVPILERTYGKLIAGAKVTIIPDCGHLPHIEQPDAFAATLKSFLDAMRIAA